MLPAGIRMAGMMTLDQFLAVWTGIYLLAGLLFTGICVHWLWSWALWRWSAREMTRIPTRWL
jgi:hypothetical protein